MSSDASLAIGNFGLVCLVHEYLMVAAFETRKCQKNLVAGTFT
jgi:hypothetical protein